MRQLVFWGVAALAALHVGTAHGTTTIGFGGTGLNEGDALTNQIGKVTFSGAILAEEGDPVFAYGPSDAVFDGPGGGWFLTDALGAGGDFLEIPGPVEMMFNQPVEDLSFLILDLDGESVTAEAFDVDDILIETVATTWPDVGGLSGRGFPFVFSSSGISSVTITVVGLAESPTQGGWALDDLAFVIPEPSSLGLLALAMGGLALARRRRP